MLTLQFNFWSLEKIGPNMFLSICACMMKFSNHSRWVQVEMSVKQKLYLLFYINSKFQEMVQHYIFPVF